MSPLRFRLTTAGVVASLLAASHLALPDGRERAFPQYLFVITLGYGHLIGAALGARRRGVGRLAGAFGLVTLALLFVLYVEAVAAWPGLATGLLAVSVWHFTENDLALAAALRARSGLGPLPREVGRHVAGIAAAAAIVASAVAVSPDPGRLADLFAAATLFHLIGWLVFLIARGASLRRLFVLHAPAAGLGLALLAWPGGAAAPLREWMFSPAIYLFWATLHVGHTALARGRASP